MQKSTQIKFVLALLALAGTLLIWRYSWMNSAPVSAVTANTPQSAAFLAMPKGSAPQPVAEKPQAAPARPVHPLHLALANATDLRVLSEKLKTQPESGGHYYAAVINQRCSDAQEYLAELHATNSNVAHEVASRRDAALNKLRRQCEGFLRDELSVDQLALLYLSKEKDPLMAIQKQLSNRGTREQEKQNLMALLDTHSPEFINASVIRYTKDGAYFDGKTYAIGEKGDAILIQAAVALAECQLGAVCGAHDFLVVKACVTEMICADTKEDMVMQMILKDRKNPEADMEKIKLLTAQIVTAIQTRDVDKFIPK